MIDQQILSGNWREVSGKLKAKWGQLTDNELQAFNGNVEQLVGRIQEKTGESRAAVEQFLDQIGDELVVNVVPLRLAGARLELGPAEVQRVTAWRSGAGFVGEVKVGDVVSVHWSWACDVLLHDALDRLVAWTRAQLEVANQSL